MPIRRRRNLATPVSLSRSTRSPATVTGEEIGALLLDLNASGQSMVLVTHNPDLAARYAGRTLHIVDGRLGGGPAVQIAGVAGPAQAQVRP